MGSFYEERQVSTRRDSALRVALVVRVSLSFLWDQMNLKRSCDLCPAFTGVLVVRVDDPMWGACGPKGYIKEPDPAKEPRVASCGRVSGRHSELPTTNPRPLKLRKLPHTGGLLSLNPKP